MFNWNEERMNEWKQSRETQFVQRWDNKLFQVHSHYDECV